MDWIGHIEADTAPVRLLREELTAANQLIEHLRGKLNEAADKFWVCSSYVEDPQAKSCMLEKYEEMCGASRIAGMALEK